jgi:DNA-binding NarL/FixJ family response regulator
MSAGGWTCCRPGPGTADVHAVLSWSFHALSRPAVRLLCLLTLHPGPDISLPAAAALAAQPADDTHGTLRDLLDAHLLTEHVHRRYSMHDLLRAYAAEQTGSRDEGLRAALELRRARPALPILVLSQYVEQSNAAELLETGPAVGYLLKDRISEVTEFTQALERVAAGGTVIDPDVVRQLLARQRDRLPLQQLTKREHEVLTLIAEGRSNGAIARHLMISEAAIAKNIGAIFVKFGLLPTDDENRRVLAVLTFLRA